MKIKNGTNVQIEKSKREMERALEKLLQERVEIRKKIINLGGCYKKKIVKINSIGSLKMKS